MSELLRKRDEDRQRKASARVTSRARYRARRALAFALALACLIGFVAAQSQALKQRAEVEETTFQLSAPATNKSVLLIE